MNTAVHHPAHYGGKDNPYEAIKVIEAWGLGFCLGNAVKYISRAGKKNPAAVIEDLEKASWYLRRQIDQRRVDSVDSIDPFYDPSKVSNAWSLSPDLYLVLVYITESLSGISSHIDLENAFGVLGYEIKRLKGAAA